MQKIIFIFANLNIKEVQRTKKMESFATLIQNRRSTRKFTEQLLSPEQVEQILKAALMAPASKRSNPWQFVVVEDKEMLKKGVRKMVPPFWKVVPWPWLFWRM